MEYYVCFLGKVSLLCCLSPLLIICLVVLSTIESRVLKLLSIIRELSISPFSCLFLVLGILLLDEYMFLIITSFWLIDTSISVWYPWLCLVTIFYLKPILSYISWVTLALFWLLFTWNILFHSFPLTKLYLWILKFFFMFYLFLRERERQTETEHDPKRGRETRRRRIWSRL